MAKPVSEWSIGEVGAWLDSIGLAALKHAFQTNAVAGDNLLDLAHEDIVSHLGATNLQARKIVIEVGKLTGQPPKTMSFSASQGVQMAPQPTMPPPIGSPSFVDTVNNKSFAAPAVSQDIPIGQPTAADAATADDSPPLAIEQIIVGGLVLNKNPLPNVLVKEPKDPPPPGHVIIGYQVQKGKVGDISTLKRAARYTAAALLGIFVGTLGMVPCCWIPLVIPSCYNDYQSPVYGPPEVYTQLSALPPEVAMQPPAAVQAIHV